MIYKTFEEWKAGQWLEDGQPRTKAYTKDELLLIEMGWQYGFDAGKETKEITKITDEEIYACFHQYFVLGEPKPTHYELEYEDLIEFARAILRKAQNG